MSACPSVARVRYVRRFVVYTTSRRTEGVKNMAKLVFGLQQSLDGYVDHLEMGPPGPALSRHFVEHVRDLAGCVYGRRPTLATDHLMLIAGKPTFSTMKIAESTSGWEALYRDPSDGRYWERTYPQSETHGGGPPQLSTITLDEAERKYGPR